MKVRNEMIAESLGIDEKKILNECKILSEKLKTQGHIEAADKIRYLGLLIGTLQMNNIFLQRKLERLTED
jgi:hypothetical protein